MHYVAQYMYFNSCSQIYPILKGYDNKSVVLAANLEYIDYSSKKGKTRTDVY